MLKSGWGLLTMDSQEDPFKFRKFILSIAKAQHICAAKRGDSCASMLFEAGRRELA